MKYLLVITLLTCLLSNDTKAQENNFEGIIKYNRLLDDKVNARETYYFGKNRLRLDSEYYANHDTTYYSKIYNFNLSGQHYWMLDPQSGKFLKKELKQNNLIASNEIESGEDILDHNTSKIEHTYEFPFTEGSISQTAQYFWLADDLNFKFETQPNNTPYMLPYNEGKIALRLIEFGRNNILGSGYSYERIATEVIATKLEDSLFNIE